MSTGSPPVKANRDLCIDWLRGLAMACVIINHSKLSSLLSWFSYERFWVVTAAEVFVVLSGTVLGMVYGRRLARDGWRAVVRGLGRRALTLYFTFVGVTVSIVALSLAGLDVRALTTGTDRVTDWFLYPQGMDLAAWRDLMLMRSGPWAFEIVGLYVWLVVAAVPCLLALRYAGWRSLLAASWLIYLVYRLAPHRPTTAEFEDTFPILAWQLLFVHGITVGYHRERISEFVARCPKFVPIATAIASAAFLLFALCNPWMDGPSWLHLTIVPPDRFADVYTRYFSLSNLGMGRLLNLGIGLPLGYGVLVACWSFIRPLQAIFITLGQRSLGAFVLHTYGILVLAHLKLATGLWINTLVQVVLILVIAALLHSMRRAASSISRGHSAPRGLEMTLGLRLTAAE